MGNLVVLPNNRIMEIVNFEFEVPGVSNLFTNNDTKNVYKATLKTYDVKLVSELPSTDLGAVGEADYSTLDSYFLELTNERTEVDTEAEITTDVVTQPKPVVDTTEDSVFGKF